MKKKKANRRDEKKLEEDKVEYEHEMAKEEIHQAELAQGYEQDEKFDESTD